MQMTRHFIPQQAIAAGSFLAKGHKLTDGDVEVGLQQAAHVVEGEVCAGIP